MSELVALNKKKQSRFTQKVKNVKDKVKKGVITVKENIKNVKPKDSRGLVYVGHIPHGFYEEEMESYFKQFGKVTNVRVCRSRRTGNSKGYGFVEFEHASVAEIAAETMDNYLMFSRRLIAKYVPPEKYKNKKCMFRGRPWSKFEYPLKAAQKQHRNKVNQYKNEKSCLLASKRQLLSIRKKLKTLESLGVNYNFKPVDVPEDKISLVTKDATNSEWEETYVTDPYDSDIEIKVKKPKSADLFGKKSLKGITKQKEKLRDRTKLNKISKSKLLSIFKETEIITSRITRSAKKLQKTQKV